jgi:hypothetical protein
VIVDADSGPIIAFRRAKRGTLVAPYASAKEFGKGFVAVLISGPSPGDYYIDRALNKFVVMAARPLQAGPFTRFASIISPKTIPFSLEVSKHSTVTLDELKSSIESAMKSSKSVTEYWEEGNVSLEARVRRLLRAESFDDVCKALRR